MSLSEQLGEPSSLQASRDLFHRVSGRTTLALLNTEALKQTALGNRGMGIAYSLAGLAGTCGAILKISVHPAWVDECYMLGRAYLERCVNASYLAVCDESANEDFLMHAVARRYRHEDHSVTLNGHTVTIKRERPPGPPPREVEVALERFTSRTGRPKMWSDLNLEQKASAVAQAVPGVETILALSILGINGRASESLHGSFFGLTTFPAPGPASNLEDGSESIGEFDWSARNSDLVALLIALARTSEVLMAVLAARAESAAVTAQADLIKAEISEFIASFTSDKSKAENMGG
jgi:hypothetical protein